MSSTQTGFLDNLVTAARDNPLAAALVGGGVFWLLAGNDTLKRAAAAATASASPIVESGTDNLRAAASGLKRTAAPPTAPEMDHDNDMLRGGRNAASDAEPGAADKIRDRFNEGVGYARESLGSLTEPLPGKEAFAKAQSSLAAVLERQPLVLGVVGLAIGAAVAGAFRPSDIENEWLGQASDDVKDELNTRAGAVSQSLRDASDTLKAELGDTGAEAMDRLKQAGMDAADAAREKVKSG